MDEIEDSYLDELNFQERAPTAPCPVPQYIQFKQEQMVAEALHISVLEAQKLPVSTFDFYLRAVTAEREAAPAIEEARRERGERRAEEDKARREAMDEY